MPVAASPTPPVVPVVRGVVVVPIDLLLDHGHLGVAATAVVRVLPVGALAAIGVLPVVALAVIRVLPVAALAVIRVAAAVVAAVAGRRVVARAVSGYYERRARLQGKPRPRAGAVVFVQRFDSGLRLNVHFHALVLAGVAALSLCSGP